MTNDSRNMVSRSKIPVAGFNSSSYLTFWAWPGLAINPLLLNVAVEGKITTFVSLIGKRNIEAP